MTRYFVGEGCLCWSLGDHITHEISTRILAAYSRLKTELLSWEGIRDIVPSYTCLAVHFNPLQMNIDELVKVVEDVLGHEKSDSTFSMGHLETFDVNYSGMDLARVARLTCMTENEVVKRHTAPEYTIAMIGFLPHFPYLIGLDPSLETPRLEQPRKKVPEGAVAIGGAQTGIYPAPSPGGWNIIGVTDPAKLLNLKPGDRIRFREK